MAGKLFVEATRLYYITGCMMTKREITPHKGGRDKQLKIRVTQDEYEMIRNIADELDMSQADLIVLAVEGLKKRESE